ncbi:MAG TPA: class I SAM-dependent methyltransferase [Candidatus Saccharimonadales bacterium]
MSLLLLKSHAWTRRLLWRIAAPRARDTYRYVKQYLRPGEKLLDIGPGICDVTLLFQKAGYPIIGVDVQDISCTPLIKPVLYDGRTMPFTDQQFDTTLFLTVLHHIPKGQQEQVLREAVRVSKRVLITEDVYRTVFAKYVTFAIDSLLNFEFIGHPHSNRDTQEWYQLFNKLPVKLQVVGRRKLFGFLRQEVYMLEAR